MRSLLKRIFINNWPRKVLSIILAIFTWFIVNQSLTATKTISNIPVRVANIPPGKTIEGIQTNGYLSKRMTLIITGNKTLLEDLTSNDLEIVVDATGRQGEWVATITKKNLVPTNPDMNLSQGISKVVHKNFIIKLSKLVTEKIPIIITQPIGEAPKGYQFIDIWPYQLYITVSGPEEVLKSLKTRGVKLTFNLNDISRAQLDDLRATSNNKNQDAISFFVPNHWKQITLPVLSSVPLEINDPNAKFLRIDFVRYELLKLESAIPVNLYFPPKSTNLNPQKTSVAANGIVQSRFGIKIISEPLYAKGVSSLFVDIIRDMLELVVVADPKHDSAKLEWSTQFVRPRFLEDRYVSTLMSDVTDDELHDLQPQLREEVLRNRFRNYMNRFQLFKQDNTPFTPTVELHGNSVTISEKQELDSAN